MMIRYVLIVMLAIFAALQYKLWVSQDGIPEIVRLQNQVEKQLGQNEKLRKENTRLTQEVSHLKMGDKTLEERARKELGMIKPGERFYRVIEKKKT